MSAGHPDRHPALQAGSAGIALPLPQDTRPHLTGPVLAAIYLG